MIWQCPACYNTQAVVDASGEEPRIVGCLECEWHRFVEVEGKLPARCISPTISGLGGFRGRCSRPVDLNGMCWQHADKGRAWDIVYARFRNSGEDDIPDAYREIFARACQDVGLLAADERNAQREEELRQRAAVAVSPTRRRLRERPSVVYFMRREGLIKIGVTTDITKRAKAVSRGSSMPDGMTVGPVEVLATTPGDGAFESKLHRQFRESRFQGEWFKPTPRLLRLIARYQRRAADSWPQAKAA